MSTMWPTPSMLRRTSAPSTPWAAYIPVTASATAGPEIRGSFGSRVMLSIPLNACATVS